MHIFQHGLVSEFDKIHSDNKTMNTPASSLEESITTTGDTEQRMCLLRGEAGDLAAVSPTEASPLASAVQLHATIYLNASSSSSSPVSLLPALPGHLCLVLLFLRCRKWNRRNFATPLSPHSVSPTTFFTTKHHNQVSSSSGSSTSK